MVKPHPDLPPCPFVAGYDPTWVPREGHVALTPKRESAEMKARRVAREKEEGEAT